MIDRGSVDWPKTKRHLLKLIDIERDALERSDPERTRFHQGRISAYRGLIDEVEPDTPPQNEPKNSDAPGLY